MVPEQVPPIRPPHRKALALFVSLIVGGVLASSCALRRDVVLAQGPSCAPALTGAIASADWRLAVDGECTLTVSGRDGRVVGQLRASELDPRRGSLRRVVATSGWLLALYAEPARLTAYRLPTLTPVEVVGDVDLRVPADLAILEGAQGAVTAYILDNAPESDRFDGAERSATGSQVVCLNLDPHVSDRRDVLVARAAGRFASHNLRYDEWRTLERIELSGREVGIVVDENGRKFKEYYTLDGLRLEREPIVRSH